jgi:hypothetical protein
MSALLSFTITTIKFLLKLIFLNGTFSDFLILPYVLPHSWLPLPWLTISVYMALIMNFSFLSVYVIAYCLSPQLQFKVFKDRDLNLFCSMLDR